MKSIDIDVIKVGENHKGVFLKVVDCNKCYGNCDCDGNCGSNCKCKEKKNEKERKTSNGSSNKW